MASCYKMWTIVEGSSGCLPHGWTRSAVILVYFRFTFGTTAQPCTDVFAFFGDLGQWKSVSMAREVGTDIQQLEGQRVSSSFWLMHSGSGSTYIAVFVLSVIYALI